MYSDEGGFDDLLPKRATTSAPTYSFPADDSLDDNPFADMESSRIVYDRPEPSPFGSSAAQEVPPSTPHVQERQFERESAPEPETPFGQNNDDTSYPGTSPSPYYPTTAPVPPPIPQPSRQQSKAEMAALMGEPTPILPHFAATFKSNRPATATAKALPVNLTGKKQGEGALAALLGFDPTPEQIASAKDKVEATKSIVTKPAVEIPVETTETTAVSSPLPASPSADTPPGSGVSRTPSLAPSTLSEISTTAGTSLYGIIVSPMDSSESTLDGDGGSKQLERTVEAKELEAGLQRLSVKEEEGTTPTGEVRTESSEAVEREGEDVDQTTPVKTQSEAPVDSNHSAPTPSSTATPQPPAVHSAVEEPALPATPLFDDNSTPSRGFRSYNYDEPMGEGFGGPEHQTSFSQDPSRASTGMERDDSLRTIGLDSDRGSMLSGQTAGPTESPPLPSAPTFSSSPTRGTVDSSGTVDVTASLAPTFVISVGDPQKVGSSLNVATQHTVYTVRTKTTSSSFRKPEFSVLRRFSHFLWLFDALTLNNPGVIVPGMPEKSAMGRFGSDFVENRRSALQAALMKMVSHPMLVGDPDLRLFLESDSLSNDIKQRKVDTPAENKGFLASLGNSIAGPKFFETDEYFDTRRHILDSFELQLRSLLVSLAASSKSRHALQTSLGELQSALLALSQCDLSTPLKGALEQAAGVKRKLRELSEVQSANEEETGGLTSVAEGYARLCGSVRLVFSSRVKAYHQWQATEANAKKARSALEKAKKSGRTHPDLLGGSLAEISDAERKAMDAKQDFDDVGKLIKAEMIRFDKEKVEDFKRAVEEYAIGMVLRQRQVVAVWQDYFDLISSLAGANVSGSNGAPGESVTA